MHSVAGEQRRHAWAAVFKDQANHQPKDATKSNEGNVLQHGVDKSLDARVDHVRRVDLQTQPGQYCRPGELAEQSIAWSGEYGCESSTVCGPFRRNLAHGVARRALGLVNVVDVEFEELHVFRHDTIVDVALLGHGMPLRIKLGHVLVVAGTVARQRAAVLFGEEDTRKALGVGHPRHQVVRRMDPRGAAKHRWHVKRHRVIHERLWFDVLVANVARLDGESKVAHAAEGVGRQPKVEGQLVSRGVSHGEHARRGVDWDLHLLIQVGAPCVEEQCIRGKLQLVVAFLRVHLSRYRVKDDQAEGHAGRVFAEARRAIVALHCAQTSGDGHQPANGDQRFTPAVFVHPTVLAFLPLLGLATPLFDGRERVHCDARVGVPALPQQGLEWIDTRVGFVVFDAHQLEKLLKLGRVGGDSRFVLSLVLGRHEERAHGNGGARERGAVVDGHVQIVGLIEACIGPKLEVAFDSWHIGM